MPISQQLLDDIKNNVYREDMLSISGEDLPRDEDIDDKDFLELITCLRENKYIKEIRLVYIGIGDESAKLMVDLGFLERVEVPNTKIGKIGVQALLKSKTIKYLNIGSLDVEDDWLIGIGENNTLYSLNAHTNSITSTGAKLISQNTSLKDVNLYGNPIEHDGVESLVKMKSLKHLVVCQREETYIEVPSYHNPPITSYFDTKRARESSEEKEVGSPKKRKLGINGGH